MTLCARSFLTNPNAPEKIDLTHSVSREVPI